LDYIRVRDATHPTKNRRIAKVKLDEKCAGVIEKATEWLVSCQEKDGSFGKGATDLRCYYKAPSVLLATGRLREASLTTDWIKHKFLKPDGDFRGDNGKSEFAFFAKHRYIYMNGWLVSGLQRLGRFDMSLPALKYILSFQDHKQGGFFSHASENYKPLDDQEDLASTASCGVAALFCGKLKESKRTGDFLTHLLDVQPDINEQLYVTFRPGHGLIMEFPEEEASNRIVRIKRENEPYWLPGLAIGFLCKLYQATGVRKYLDTARRYYSFLSYCAEDRFQSYASGKAAWGCSILYRLTGDEGYLEYAQRVTKHIVDTQLPDGTWLYTPFVKKIEDQPLALTLDLTAEMAYWLSQILFEVSRSTS
jgi:hypothetical protein